MSKPGNPMVLKGIKVDGTFSAVTLRDLFAAFCAMGINANSEVDYNSAGMAEAAYADADAMLAEREKEQPE